METDLEVLPENIANHILYLRGEKVILDNVLAKLYQVDVKSLKRAVKRNLARFPSDFMFEITREEYNSLRYQIGTLDRGKHSKYLPYAFSEQGVAMLSGILHSARAIQTNIAIMRVFVLIRRSMETNHELTRKINDLEKSVAGHDEKITLIFQAIKQMIEKKIEPPPPRTAIGYRIGKEEK
jgi:hypothetical protein